jgi:hypothetical protein
MYCSIEGIDRKISDIFRKSEQCKPSTERQMRERRLPQTQCQCHSIHTSGDSKNTHIDRHTRKKHHHR